MFPRHSKDPVGQEMNESREDYVKTIYALKLMRQTEPPAESVVLFVNKCISVITHDEKKMET